MSKFNLDSLNPQQKQIASTLDRPLFVEAGAGSGKTFTLTRRVIWALCEGSGPDGSAYIDDISQVLLITFTEAAAAEIAARLRLGLREAGMADQALKVDDAWISTIHGMCLRILKRHALDLGLDPDLKPVGEVAAAAIFSDCINEVLSHVSPDYAHYESFCQIKEELGLGSENYSKFIDYIRTLIAYAHASKQGFSGLLVEDKTDLSFELEALINEAASFQAVLTTVKNPTSLSFQDFLAQLVPQLEARRALHIDSEELFAYLSSLKFPKNSLRNESKEAFAVFHQQFLCLMYSCLLSRGQRWLACLLDLASQVDSLRIAKEAELGLIENDDLISLALAAVRDDPRVSAAYAGKFKLVMVDEFQDTDAKQLELISLLSGGAKGPLATVGDAQQSIYRFRGADVSVFRSRGAQVDEKNKVQLAVNYRSHKDVLALVDKICGGERGVLKDFMHLDYFAERKDGYASNDIPRIQFEVAEAGYLAGALGRLGHAEQMAERFYEHYQAGTKLSNMALLTGATTHLAEYLKALRARGMDCLVTGGSLFSESDEVKDIEALLKLLANPYNLRSGTFPALKSDIFALDDADLLELASALDEESGLYYKENLANRLTDAATQLEEHSERLKLALKLIAHATDSLRYQSMSSAVYELIQASGYFVRQEALGPDGFARAANVLAAIRYIKSLEEELCLGPNEVAYEFSHFLRASKLTPKNLHGQESEAIKVMTIHSSKGLEFDVVGLIDCWSDPKNSGPMYRYKSADYQPGDALSLVFSPSSLDDINLELADEPSTTLETYYLAKAQEYDELAEEKTRLLYVGLTRAREALIVGVSYIKTSKGFSSVDLAEKSLNALLDGNTQLDEGEHWIDFGGSSPLRLRRVVYKRIEKDTSVEDFGKCIVTPDEHLKACVLNSLLASKGEVQEIAEKRQFARFEPDLRQLDDETFTWNKRRGVYSYSSAHAELEKNFVPSDMKEAKAEILAQLKHLKPVLEDEESEAAEPRSFDADRATDFGSAFHELAQVMVETNTDELDLAQIEAVSKYWSLSKKQHARLLAALSNWQKSQLRKEALSWENLRAETPFFAPIKSAFGDFVEGAIDLLCTDGGSSCMLVDYKTGDLGLSAEQIYTRHEMQANFYATVLMRAGFERVDCNFVCVEVKDEDTDDLFVARYPFDADKLPRLDF